MTNQQLKAHCEDVIANPQDHLDWVVDMARVALASLEAEPVGYIHNMVNPKDVGVGRLFAEENRHYARAIYTAPPVPELKPIELPVMQVDNPIDGLFYKCDEVIAAIRAAGYEAKSS